MNIQGNIQLRPSPHKIERNPTGMIRSLFMVIAKKNSDEPIEPRVKTRRRETDYSTIQKTPNAELIRE